MSDLDPRDEWYSKKKLNRIFFWSSLALLASTAWMVYADWNREWKSYQRDFRAIERERFRIERKALRETLHSSETYAAVWRAVNDAKAEAARNAEEVAGIEGGIEGLSARIFVADQKEKLARSLAGVAKSEIEAGRSPTHEEFDRQMADAERWRKERERLETERSERQRALSTARAGLDAARAQKEALLRDWIRVKKALSHATPSLGDWIRDAPLIDFMIPTTQIKQLVPEHLDRDINFGRTQRVDRCITCHLGIDKKEFALTEDGTAFADPNVQVAAERAAARAGGGETARAKRLGRYLRVYSAHPRLDLYLSSSSAYPIDRYACTVCHEGNGQATTFNDAVHVAPDEETEKRWEDDYHYHYNHFWQWPMLAGSRVEGSLQRLRKGNFEIPEAPHVNRGLALVERYQCYACHKIARAEEAGLAAHAPTLRRAAAKLRPGWVYAWLRNPRSIRPATRMPRFFGLENVMTDEDRLREEEEVKAITLYLFSVTDTAPFGAAAPPAGDAARGKALFAEVGCQGCHRVESEEETARDQAAGRAFGPSLDGIGTKASRGWIYAWIRNPKSYDPATKMPDMRLSDGEAADITAYLASLKTETALPGNVPAPDAAVLRRMAYDLLRKRRPLEEARSLAEGMAERELVAFVGEAAVGRYGCYSCHAVAGFEGRLPIGTELSDAGRKPVVRFDFGMFHGMPHTRDAWYLQKLRQPRAYDLGKVLAYDERSRMPDFGLTDTDASAITTAILGWNEEKIHPSLVARSPQAEIRLERILLQRGCRSCHIVAGHGGGIAEILEAKKAPPPLIRQGARVRGEWLRAFLRDPGAMRVRPNLSIRMPTFGFDDGDLSDVVEGFAGRDGVAVLSEPFAADPARAVRGSAVYAKLGCPSCHVTGTSGSSPTSDVPAPPLGLVAGRVRPEWAKAWILGAARLYSAERQAAGLAEASIMPSYDEVLPGVATDGDTEGMLGDLIHYLYTLGR